MTDNSGTIGNLNEKYQVLLKFINKILSNIGKESIKNLTEFKDIERYEIIKEDNFGILVELKEEIFEHFDCRKCGWYRRKTVKNYILTFLRYALEELNLKLSYRELKKQTDGIVVSKVLYSITN